MAAFRTSILFTLICVSYGFLQVNNLTQLSHQQFFKTGAPTIGNMMPLDRSIHAKSPKLKSSISANSVDISDGEELTKEKISSILEVTFIESCLQIASGYVDVLKLFLATTRAAHEMKIPIPELAESIKKMDVKNNSANRQLSPEEINLRTLWIDVSYLTLELLQTLESNVEAQEEKSLSISFETRETYEAIIEKKVHQFLGKEEEKTSNDDFDLGTSDPVQLALMRYSLKIIDTMLVVVKEARAANESYGIDEDGVGPPRPPIPYEK